MAVPKRKTSKARKNSRRSSVWKLKMPAFAKCEQCGELRAPHKVCSLCGYYNGKEVIVIKKQA